MLHRHDLLVDGPIIAIAAIFVVLRVLGYRRASLVFGIIFVLMALASNTLLPK